TLQSTYHVTYVTSHIPYMTLFLSCHAAANRRRLRRDPRGRATRTNAGRLAAVDDDAGTAAALEWRGGVERGRHRRSHASRPRPPFRSRRAPNGRGHRLGHRRTTRTRGGRSHQVSDHIVGKLVSW